METKKKYYKKHVNEILEKLTKAENTANVTLNKEPKSMNGRKPKKLTEEQAAKACRMRKDGFSFRDIGKLFDVSDRTIRRYVELNVSAGLHVEAGD